ncbi:MAG: hemin uptake protein HemP [Betaproteobacteria bacterium]|nr:hemin uptake protein HemP [Betaproteobacteria bacterium]
MDNLSITHVNKTISYKPVIPNQDATIHSDLLFVNGDVLLIQHRGEQYLLRRTRNGKLILTK